MISSHMISRKFKRKGNVYEKYPRMTFVISTLKTFFVLLNILSFVTNEIYFLNIIPPKTFFYVL